MNARVERGIRVFEADLVTKCNGFWEVHSENQKKIYRVTRDGCECPDNDGGKLEVCKHMWAVWVGLAYLIRKVFLRQIDTLDAEIEKRAFLDAPAPMLLTLDSEMRKVSRTTATAFVNRGTTSH